MSSLDGNNFAVSVSSPIPGHHIDILDMYNASHRDNGSFGIHGYKVPKEYLDSREIKQMREGNKPKAAPRATKKGDYLTEAVKIANGIPAPNQYNVVKPWVDEKKKPTQPKYGSKKTFLEEIELEAKRRPVPGPGAYDLLKEKKKPATLNKPKGDRDNFLMDYEYMSNTIPGPGNYNPRQIQPKIRPNKFAPEDWKKKHAAENSAKKAGFPDVGTYSPFAADFDTFDKILAKSAKSKSTSSKLWGTEARPFDKKKKVAVAPGPGQYNLMPNWGPDVPKEKKDLKSEGTKVFNKISTGITKSIYYS